MWLRCPKASLFYCETHKLSHRDARQVLRWPRASDHNVSVFVVTNELKLIFQKISHHSLHIARMKS